MGDGDRESKSKVKCFKKEVAVIVFSTTAEMSEVNYESIH